jgi:hypothetical protein
MEGGTEHGGENVANDGWIASPAELFPVLEAI